VLAPLGRRVDRTSPIVDARLADGARVCAVLPPVAVDGPALSIRRFRRRILPHESFTDDVGVGLLHELLHARCNLVVVGATSSGKTSLVAALLSEIDPSHRLVIVEDTAELPLRHPHALRLEARPPTIDGPGAVDLAQLVRTSLRLRPDRIVVGEARGDEVLALVQAMNTGHDGSISTCHANSPTDALLRLESLVLQAAPTWPLAAIRHQLARSIDVVIHLERDEDGARRIIELAEVTAPSPADDHHPTPATRPLAMQDVDGHLVAVASLERRRR
jgi:pilus assembly protein CpaF